MIIVKNRELLIPNNERYIGTTYDTDTENRIFQVPRYSQRGVDLAALIFRLDIQYANESYDTIVLDKEIGEAFVILIWRITSSTLQVPGTMYIGLRAVDNEATVKWSSFSAAMYVERHLNTPGNYGGGLTEIEQMEQDHQYMKGVVNELKANLDYAHDAEAWAVGKRSGTDVPSTDEAYHNNSKYYKELSDGHRQTSERFAKGTVNGSNVSSGDGYHDNSKYYKELADNHRKTAEAYAKGTVNGTAVTSGQTGYQDNAKYYKEQIQSRLNQIDTNASNIAVQTARIDQFTHLEEGTTTGDAELMDIRVGADGVTYASAGAAVRANDSLLKSQLEAIVDFDSYNLIKGKSITPTWYVNPNTGEGSTNTGFFSVTDVDVSDVVGLFLFIYTSKSDVNVDHTARSVAFYNASGTYISGMSGGSLSATNGYRVPTNAKFMSVTFHYENGQLPSVFYVSKSIIPENYDAIKQSVEVPVACVPGLTDIMERTSNLFDPSYLVTTAKCNRIGNEYIGAAGDFRAFVNGYPVTFDDPDAAYTFSADIKIEGGTTGVVTLGIAFGYGDSATNGVNVYPGGTYERYILHTSTTDHGGVTKLILNNPNTAGAKVYIKNAMLVKGQETSYIPYKAAVDATARQQVAELAEEIEQGVSGNATNIRFPCINFQFDDGAANDANIVSIFQQFNLTCGFAIISNMSSSDVTRYLGYQTDGFEMICHADSGTGMADATVSPETIENRLKTSKDILERYGFHIKGFVTPNSTMADVFKPILRKYYQWAETVYFGSYTGTGQPYMKPVDGVYNGWRVSLQTTTLANQKAAVDACIANYGVLTFYGHSADMDGSDNLTTANLTELLTYIAAKVQNGYCKVGNPSDIIQNYFNVRNDDISSDWISVPYTDASLELDSRLEVLNWDMRYSPKLKLFSFGARLRATEAISGTFIICKMPVRTYFNGIQLINESSGKIMIYDGKITSYLSSWGSGTSYRMNVVCACY